VNPGAVVRPDPSGPLPDGNLKVLWGMSAAYAMEKGDFNHLVPQTIDQGSKEVKFEGQIYRLDRRFKFDTDGDGVKESFLQRYVNVTDPNKQIISYATKGILWAWAIWRDFSKNDDLINNFVIVDAEGKGLFDTRYHRRERFTLPNYLKN
jgi:hypothetical protein